MSSGPWRMMAGSGTAGHDRFGLALTGAGAVAVAVAVSAALLPGPVFGLASRRWVMAASTVFVLLAVWPQRALLHRHFGGGPSTPAPAAAATVRPTPD
jgi:hypothetical protein